jgi:hypothetical protein
MFAPHHHIFPYNVSIFTQRRCTKRTVLTQEVLRVMMNCSRILPWEK